MFQMSNIPGTNETAVSINVEDGHHASMPVMFDVANIQGRADRDNIRGGSAVQMSGRGSIAGHARGQRGSASRGRGRGGPTGLARDGRGRAVAGCVNNSASRGGGK
jgi:hypothetical protein